MYSKECDITLLSEKCWGQFRIVSAYVSQ